MSQTSNYVIRFFVRPAGPVHVRTYVKSSEIHSVQLLRAFLFSRWIRELEPKWDIARRDQNMILCAFRTMIQKYFDTERNANTLLYYCRPLTKFIKLWSSPSFQGYIMNPFRLKNSWAGNFHRCRSFLKYSNPPTFCASRRKAKMQGKSGAR